MWPVFSIDMACKLIVRRLQNGREQTVAETFERDKITIGRGVGNDLVLKDPTRVVSTKHAEIYERQEVWSVCDVGSVNGTILNGAKIAQKKIHELHDGDRLTIGPYELVFQAVQTVPAAHPEVDSSSNTTAMDSERLRYLLQRAYGEFDGSSAGEVESHLATVFHRAIQGCDGNAVRSAVHALPVLLGRASDHPADLQKAPPSRFEVVPPEPCRQNAQDQALSSDRARQVYDELGVSSSSVDPDHMAKQLTALLHTLFTGLADAMRGRREFQKEFEVQPTRILAWTPNPIKHAENAAEIATILLNPASCELTDQEAIASLREVMQDLTLHQLGLLAGFQECVRGLLKELDPEALRISSTGESQGKGLGLLGGGSVRAEAAAWRRYVEKHRRMTEEEVKIFERILAPHFAKGYLSVHKSRKRS